MFDYKKRDTPGEINRQSESILNSPGLSNLIGDIPNMIIILNLNRQIVYMNRRFSEVAGKNKGNGRQGMRPGDCLKCLHASGARYGCGSTDFCKVCGLACAINNSAAGNDATGECNINLEHGETLTFRVFTRPLDHNGERYIFVYMQDISDYKTRQMLENIFLHDINNSITALNGLSEMIDELPFDEARSIINDLSMRLTDEVHSYRLITEAENHMLSVMITNVDVDRLIENIIRSLTNNRYLRFRKINHLKGGIVLKTDETLLRRVLINTIKNALEASSNEEEITIFSNNGKKEGHYQIGVRSLPLINHDTQLKLFQRAWSTKGPGRGWGTYSIRLLTEKYLGGKVGFVSNSRQRTLFTINIPDLEMSAGVAVPKDKSRGPGKKPRS